MVLLCYDAGESRRGAVLLRPFGGRDKIAPLPSVAAEPLWVLRSLLYGELDFWPWFPSFKVHPFPDSQFHYRLKDGLRRGAL